MNSRTKTTLGNLKERGALEFGDGYRTKRSELGKPGIPILRVAEVGDGRVTPASGDHVHDSQIKKMGDKISRAQDIVLTTKGSVGRVAIIPQGFPEYVYSPQVCYFRVNDSNAIDHRYVYYWFKGNDFQDQVGSYASQTDMAAYLNLTDIRSIEISLPDIQTQRSVGEVLGALDDKIAVNSRVISCHEKIIQTRFDHLISAISKEREQRVPIVEFVDFNPKTRKPAQEEAVYVDMAALPTDSSLISTWTHRNPKSGSRFLNGDTLLARITPCLENGKTGYVDFLNGDQVGTGSTEFIVLRSRPEIPQEFSYFLARNKEFRSHAVQKMSGTSGRQRVSATDASDFSIYRPTDDELRIFGAEASRAFAHMSSLNIESRTLAQLRDTLLPQLMSGKLRVKDAERVVEDAV